MQSLLASIREDEIRCQLRPFLAGMPRKGERAGPTPKAVTRILLTPPPDRPGGGGSTADA